MDFGRFGLVPDPVSGVGQLAQRLVFTAVYSRHVGQRQPLLQPPAEDTGVLSLSPGGMSSPGELHADDRSGEAGEPIDTAFHTKVT